jgi:photosystem II stability/assembly factor-like uncharacterized protein
VNRKSLFKGWVTTLVFFCLSAALMYAQGPVTTEDLDIFTWRHIGPWTFSGRITDFAVPKGQSQIYYVATASGGLWKTEDGGIHFEPIFDQYGNMSMGSVDVAQSDPNIIYLGTGEAMHARSSSHGNGVWKSTDAGKTWKAVGLKESFFIPRLTIHPTDPNIVYVAAEGKLYDNQMDCQRGLYKTTDGGETWELVLDLKDRGVGDFVLDPDNPDVIIASGYKTYRRAWTYIDRQPGNYLYKTSDGGATWKKLTDGLPQDIKSGWNGLTIYPKNPQILYVRLDEEVNLGFDEGEGRFTLRAGRMLDDDFYFNKFKSYKIPAALAKLVEFDPVEAEDEAKLAEKLNELIEKKDFAASTGVDFAAFNAAAKKVYAGNSDMLETIAEIEKTLKRDAESKAKMKEVNAFVLETLFKDAEEGKVNKEFANVITFEEGKIKDAAELRAKGELARDPGLMDLLGIKARRFKSAARKIFKGDEAKLKAVDELTDTWAELEQGAGRYQTINRYILQALYGTVLAKMEPVKKAGVIYRSENQGESWKAMTEYKLSGGSAVVNQIEAGYSGRIEVDPNNDQILYAVEVRVMKSEDGGKTFKPAPWNGSNKCHVDTRGIWIDPLNSDHILNGNDGGVSETWDGGKHWSQKETISAQQFYDISVDNEMPYNVMGGTQDNGCWFGPSRNRNSYGVFPADWTYLPSGDGYYVLHDWWNPQWIYFESQFGGSRRMNMKTGEMISLSYRNTDEERAAGAAPQRYQWDAPIVLSPHNPGIVYVCSQHVFRSYSHGDPGTWEKISPDLSRADPERLAESKLTNLQYATVYTFAESPVKPGVYWAGTDDGNLQVSTDNGNSWTNITFKFWDKNGKPLKKRPAGAVLPFDRWVSRVEPSNHDENVCYVAYSGYRTHNEDTTYVFVTRDMGKTWEDISGGMMNPVRDIEEDPDNPDVLYLGTDYGVFVTVDGGKNWVNMSDEAPDVMIMDMDIQKRERDLAIATYGRGFYIADIAPFKEFNKETFDKDAHLFQPHRVVKWAMIERRGPSYGEFARSMNPGVEAKFYYWIKADAKDVKLIIKDLEGNVLQELRGSGKKGLHDASWNLRKPADQAEGAQSRYRRRGSVVDAGAYKVTLQVGGEDIATQTLTVADDPILSGN